MNPAGIIAVICGVALLIHAFAVRAAPPAGANPDLAPWFQNLKRVTPAGAQPHGAAGYEVLVDRETFGIDEIAWLTKFGEDAPQWVPVPDEKIVQGKANPFDRAVVCWSPWSGVICFVRPPEI